MVASLNLLMSEVKGKRQKFGTNKNKKNKRRRKINTFFLSLRRRLRVKKGEDKGEKRTKVIFQSEDEQY